MKRWIIAKSERGEVPEIDAFLADVIEVCKKHDLWLGHEDGHGGFEVVSESTQDWIESACDACEA